MPVSRPSPALVAALIGAAFAASACDLRREPAGDTGPLEASVSERVAISVIGETSLSDSASIVSLAPEPDGESVAAIVRDPAAGVTAALVLADERRDAVLLVWPDSVTAVWWLATPHQLAFVSSTGEGIRVVVDVHAAEIETVQRAAASDSATVPRATPDDRARHAIDSLYNVRAAGRPEMLRFRALTLVPAPDRPLVAVYAAALDSAGSAWNPRWLIADSSWRSLIAVDSITGAAANMPRAAAGWTADGRFLFARGRTINEAAVRGRSARN